MAPPTQEPEGETAEAYGNDCQRDHCAMGGGVCLRLLLQHNLLALRPLGQQSGHVAPMEVAEVHGDGLPASRTAAQLLAIYEVGSPQTVQCQISLAFVVVSLAIW